MKSAEKEALVKSLSLFFISLSTLFAVIIYFDYHSGLEQKEKDIYRTMKLCSYDLECKGYKLDFVDINSSRYVDELKVENGYLYSDFDIPSSSDFRLRIILPKYEYSAIKRDIALSSLYKYILLLIISAILSFLFSIYSMLPIRKALHTTEEFARDILHDFNTPLSVIRLNTASIKRKLPDSKAIGRIEKSVDNILVLQQNLREYLDRIYSKEERFDLETVLRERAEMIASGYSDTVFHFEIPQVALMTKKKEFTRIIDNILENVAKYRKNNKTNINVRFNRESKILSIEDDGIGINKPEKVFERFYRESKRQGSGLGMNIVQKLSKELGMSVEIDKSPNGGTLVELDLSSLVLDGISAR